MSGKALVGMLVVAALLGYLLKTAADTRGHDLARIDAKFGRVSCDIINRQVAGSEWQVASGRLFRDHSKSPAIRAFYRVNVPERVEALNRAKADQRRLGCLKEDK